VAAGLWREIAEQPLVRQRQRVCQMAFHTRAFFDVLLRKSREEGRKDRQRGVDIALMALDTVKASVEILEDDPRILRAQAWAWIGNARRLALDFLGAEQAFNQADIELGYRSGKSGLFVKAEILHYRGALRLDQRCFQEALDLADLAVPIFRESSDLHRYVEARIFRANVLCYSGKTGVLKELAEALNDLAKKPERRLELSALSLLATAETLHGHPRRARVALDRAKGIAAEFSSFSNFAHLDWIDGLLANTQGDAAAAETLLLSAREGFQRVGASGHEAALALDLAILYENQDRKPEAKRLTAEAFPVLAALKFDRQASKALALLADAATPGDSLIERLTQARVAVQTVLRLPALQIVAA